MTRASGPASFFRAIFVGIIVASVIPAIALGVAGLIGTSDISGSLLFAGAAFLIACLISTVFVLIGAIVIGLPATAVLKTIKAENEFSYIAVGVGGGILLPLLASPWIEPGAMRTVSLIMGPIAGGLMGRTWWQTYRKHVTKIE